jgi:hypothetical protein
VIDVRDDGHIAGALQELLSAAGSLGDFAEPCTVSEGREH